MRMPQGAEWLILLLIVVLLFGAKRLPDAARGLGRSMRIFKAETKGLTDDDAAAPAAAPATPPTPAVEAQSPVPPAPGAVAAPAPSERADG